MDLQFLRPLFEGGGPVASVYLDTTRQTHDADKQIELWWRAARRSLVEQGADEETLAALDEAVGGAPHLPGPQGEALFAAEGRLLEAHTLARPPRTDSAVLLPVPSTLQLAIDRDHQLPYVVVAVDRTGADVDAYPAAAHEPSFQRSFSGSTLHVTRVRGGAEAHASYHRRTVNLWSENAAQAAADVRAAIEEVGAQVVLVAGDPKAVGLLREHLDDRSLPGTVVYVEGGRADDTALAALRDSVEDAVSAASDASHRAALDELEGRLAGGLALQGLPAVKEALAQGRVETLFLAADRSADPQLYSTRTNPLDLATDPAALGDDPTAFQAPAGELLIRAAALSGAEFTEILPPARYEDGVAALLRFG